MKYQQTPIRIMQVLEMFHQHKLSYILFKCEHIFEGKNKNVDILFESNHDYREAAKILQGQGFAVQLSERVEKYKTLLIGMYQGKPCSIHLHREIAWHGMIALDKKEVFKRKRRINPLIILPGIEDSILIHAAHVLFENFKIREVEKKYFSQWNNKGIGQRYILGQARKKHWEKGLLKVIQQKKSPAPVPWTLVFNTWIKKLSREPLTTIYLSKKAAKRVLRPLTFQRQGCLIALIGVNGSGKTTLSKKALEKFRPLTSHLGKEQHYYYFGWNPTFFLTKCISKLLQKRNKKLFKDINLTRESTKFNLFQELLFAYIFIEFYYRYLLHIRPKLKQGHLVITDRYFYDIYGQYPYARNSLLIKPLLHLFPAPDYTYLLDGEIEDLIQRKKTDRVVQEIALTQRKALPLDYLQRQKNNYLFLRHYLSTRYFDAITDVRQNATRIIQETWREVL